MLVQVKDKIRQIQLFVARGSLTLGWIGECNLYFHSLSAQKIFAYKHKWNKIDFIPL